LAVLPLVHAPHPVLRQNTRQVKNIDRRVRKLVDDMIETMHDANGVGLAANQVGVSLRVAVIHLPDDDEATVLINPKVMRAEGEREIEGEGCLSIPGYRGMVRRSVKVRAKGLDRNGKQVKVSAEELLAQALEHEIDHLDGTLYIDQLVSRDQLWKEEPEEESEGAPVEDEPVEAGYTG
jgi:peptide deformylase